MITRLALLLHDVGKPITKTIDESGKAHFFNHALEGEKIARNVLRRLKFSNKIVDTVCFLIAHHSDEFISQPKYVRRAIRKISPELFPYYLDIQKADVLGQSDMTKDLVLKDNEINASRERNLLLSAIKLNMIDFQILLLLRKMQQ